MIGRLEFAMEAAVAAEPIEAKMRRAQKEGRLAQHTLAERRAAAVSQGIITQAEHDQVVRADRLRREVIMVDDFEHELGRSARGEDAWQQPERKRVAATSL